MLHKTVFGDKKVGLIEFQEPGIKASADDKPIFLFISNIWQKKIFMFCAGYYNLHGTVC